MHRVKVKVVEDALDANNTIARANRDDFDRAGVAVVNFMSAPGAGKTSLLERVLGDLEGVRAGVLEGDVEGSLDADRLAGLHVPVTQLNTGAGFGGECHLDANMVRSALPSRSPRTRSSSEVLPAPGALMKLTTATPARSKSSRLSRAIVSAKRVLDDLDLHPVHATSSTSMDSTSNSLPVTTSTAPVPHPGSGRPQDSISQSRAHPAQRSRVGSSSCSSHAPFAHGPLTTRRPK